MARPPAPSPRVWTAAVIASLIGLLTFLVWWFTSSRPVVAPRADSATAPATQSTPIARGGTLTGSLAGADERDVIAALTQATLIRVNRSTDRLEPWLAESWTEANEGAAEGATFLLKLRPDVRWSDGTPFTANDVVSSLGAAGDSLLVSGKPLGVRAIDPLQVEIKFPAPFAPGLRLLEATPIVREQKKDSPLAAGLGPFVTDPGGASAGQADLRRFVRNPHYWRKAPDGQPLPYIDALELRPGHEVELKEFLDGQLDFIESEIRPEDYAALTRAEQERKVQLYDLGPGLDADALWLNLSRGWLAKDEFRLALSTAVNRRAFCDAVYLGACDPIYGPVTTGNPAWFSPDLPAAGANPATAIAMLAGLGLQDRTGDGILDDGNGAPVRLRILAPKGITRARLGASFVRDELRKIGIDIEVQELEPDALARRKASGDYDAIYDRLEVRDTDPAMNMAFWTGWQASGWGGQLAELMRRQAGTSDRVQRVQLFADAQKMFVEHMPALFLGAPYKYAATGPRVRNATPSNRRPALLWNADTLAATGQRPPK